MKNFTLGRLFAWAAALILIVFVLSSSLFVVDQRQRAILVQFGRVVQADLSPGLHFKLPFIQQVLLFEGRLHILSLPEESYLSSEQKRLIVDSYFIWRITDPLLFFTATQGDPRRATTLLTQRVDSGLRNRFGTRTIIELVSGAPASLTESLTKEVDAFSQKELGVEVLDARVKRVDFSSEISDSVFDRMRSDREQEARNIRAQGNQTASEMRAEADKGATVLLAEANKKSAIIRGEGDAKSATILRTAFDQNPRYYRLYQKLKTLQEGLNQPKDVLIINPKSDLIGAMTR